MKPIPNNNSLRIILILNGMHYSVGGELPETAIKSIGPMSLESGIMGLVRELCQQLYRNVNLPTREPS